MAMETPVTCFAPRTPTGSERNGLTVMTLPKINPGASRSPPLPYVPRASFSIPRDRGRPDLRAQVAVREGRRAQATLRVHMHCGGRRDSRALWCLRDALPRRAAGVHSRGVTYNTPVAARYLTMRARATDRLIAPLR